MSMDQYIQGLFNLANDPSADVRKLVFTVDITYRANLFIIMIEAAFIF